MRKGFLLFGGGIVVGLTAAYIGSLALRSNHSDMQNAGVQKLPQTSYNLPRSQWPTEWLRIEAFMDAVQTCKAKIKTKTFNPYTIHWVEKPGEEPTEDYFESKHVIQWYFDTRNDHGSKLYWTGICTFDAQGNLDDFVEAERRYEPKIDTQ